MVNARKSIRRPRNQTRQKQKNRVWTRDDTGKGDQRERMVSESGGRKKPGKARKTQLQNQLKDRRKKTRKEGANWALKETFRAPTPTKKKTKKKNTPKKKKKKKKCRGGKEQGGESVRDSLATFQAGLLKRGAGSAIP